MGIKDIFLDYFLSFSETAVSKIPEAECVLEWQEEFTAALHTSYVYDSTDENSIFLLA